MTTSECLFLCSFLLCPVNTKLFYCCRVCSESVEPQHSVSRPVTTSHPSEPQNRMFAVLLLLCMRLSWLDGIQTHEDTSSETNSADMPQPGTSALSISPSLVFRDESLQQGTPRRNRSGITRSIETTSACCVWSQFIVPQARVFAAQPLPGRICRGRLLRPTLSHPNPSSISQVLSHSRLEVSQHWAC